MKFHLGHTLRATALTLTVLMLFAASAARAEEGDESDNPTDTATETTKDSKTPAKPAAPEEDRPVIKVLKLRKRTAVVVFSKKHPPLKLGEFGRVVPLATKEHVDVEGPSRAHFIGIDSNFEMLNVTTTLGSTTSSSKNFNANLTYGWNKERIEYGVTLGYQFSTSTDASNNPSDTRTIFLGGVFDFNFTPNTLEHEFITALRLNAQYGQVDASAQKAAGTAWQLEPGLVIKWFGLSPNLGATAFFGYRMRNDTIDTVKISTSGLVGRLGIQAYF